MKARMWKVYQIVPFLIILLLLSTCMNDDAGITPEDESEETVDDPVVHHWGPEPGPPIQRPVYKAFGSTITGYYETIPASYDTSEYRSYPLMIFLHGAGDRGDGSLYQLMRVLTHGPPMLVDRDEFPYDFFINGQYEAFIIISPQIGRGLWTSPQDIDSLITHCIQQYRIDSSRIYMTGLSMGGGGTWDYPAEGPQYAERLAAIVPICGQSNATADRARIIAEARVKVWAVHSQYDQLVPSSISRNYVRWINEVSPGLARITLYPDNSHNSYTRTYNPEYREEGLSIYEWMLHQRRE